MKCPCENCLCVPICRYKVYVELCQCSLIKKYLFEPYLFDIRPPNRVLKIEKCLNPTIWTPVILDDGGIYIGLKKVD